MRCNGKLRRCVKVYTKTSHHPYPAGSPRLLLLVNTVTSKQTFSISNYYLSKGTAGLSRQHKVIPLAVESPTVFKHCDIVLVLENKPTIAHISFTPQHRLNNGIIGGFSHTRWLTSMSFPLCIYLMAMVLPQFANNASAQ